MSCSLYRTHPLQLAEQAGYWDAMMMVRGERYDCYCCCGRCFGGGASDGGVSDDDGSGNASVSGNASASRSVNDHPS